MVPVFARLGLFFVVCSAFASDPADVYDPLAAARAAGSRISNYEATVPPACYTKTEGQANVCWTCHTQSTFPNQMNDVALQEEYAFSEVAQSNAWGNLFVDRRAEAAAISDAEMAAYVREDNYTPLRNALAERSDYPGYQPDLDWSQGFDQDGFARDGSSWRAFRYPPFPGTFWPTNGATDDVLIRLPQAFRTRAGVPDVRIYRINLALLEAAIAAGPETLARPDWQYPCEPLDEVLCGVDLDGNGRLGQARFLRGLPSHFVGDAQSVKVQAYLYPRGTEFLHSVRYLDPDAPNMMATRMKELRYMRKIALLDTWALNRRYEKEYDEKEEGRLPVFAGSALVGVQNGFGWLLQGFIEDAAGRLRLQTQEEHQACMGCHSAIGVTVDQTFALPRKVPGREGWAYQDLTGIPDVPQQGHRQGEIATYLQRAGGGDPFRANEEMLATFFDEQGQLRQDLLRETEPGGSQDIRALILPSQTRAWALNKAYLCLVRSQKFTLGRDVVLSPPANVHRRIENGSTDLAPAGKVFGDGRAWLQWPILSKEPTGQP